MKDVEKINEAVNVHSFAFLIGFIPLVFLVSLVSSPKSVSADGLFQEQLSASFEDRKADSIIKMMASSSYNRNIREPKSKANHPI
jgi:hypothetical protein